MTTTMRTIMSKAGTKTVRSALVVGAALSGLFPLSTPPAAAQATTCEGRVAGGLGITGLRCRDCSFTTNDGAMTRARFGTEPEVLGVREGSSLRHGDVLVAVDGRLITTREGAARLTTIRPGELVELRVRRDGRTETLSTRASEICLDDTPAPDAPVAPLPRSASVRGALPPLPALVAPEPPAVSAMRPAARLGFSFDCSRCHYDMGDALWSFDVRPRVQRVEPGGPADRRLQPGDELLTVNGQEITTAAGGRAFSEIRAGEEVVWTVARNGESVRVVTEAETKVDMPAPPAASTPREPAPPAAPSPRAAPSPDAVVSVRGVSDVLRYVGTHGPASIEVRGQPVTVTFDEEANVVVIRTPGNEIRIEVDRAGGGN